MSRLIVLSNRVKMPDNNPMAGGLAVALSELLKESSGIWMGWNGQIAESDNAADSVVLNNGYKDNGNEFTTYTKSTSVLSSVGCPASTLEITYITTALTPKQYEHYYCGFANNVLWPLLHEQTDLIRQAPEDYDSYQSVNRLFAQQLKQFIQPDDVIWVHDYHFLSVAYYCRQLGITNRIGFFLHIPFAPLKFWQQLDRSPELIEHLSHYDVFGTQTQHDKANCLTVMQHYLKPSSVTQHGSAHCLTVNLGSRRPHRLTVDAYPIGVNVAKIQQLVSPLSLEYGLDCEPNTHKNTHIKAAAQNIIAVDRIDYSKGLLERFSAYSVFLQQYPNYQNQLKLFQIACPSRLDLSVYQRLYDNVRQSVHEINQQFLGTDEISESVKLGSVNLEAINETVPSIEGLSTAAFKRRWQAISYCENVLSHETLMKAFWHSDIGWVNSLKDGMNLVAKEYIAAQNPANPGVLLLSRYAGAAEQMQAAVIIDPQQPDSIVQGLNTALSMPLQERKERHQALLNGLKQDNLQSWQQDFLEDLYQVV
ncbi:MAG TPA: trehalose-6-phosphate synthase [Psychrobacter sp.]|nr:trehalose-6-phosphate synthase [Psychrobacter sp.]